MITEIFELYQTKSAVRISYSFHELINQIIVFLASNSFLFQTYVKWIVQQFFVVSSYIDHDWQTSGWMNSSTGCVQSEFTNWDSHSVSAKIA